MLEHWLIELIGHVSGLSHAQLKQIEKSLPATKALVDLLNRARPIIEQAEKLYIEAEPLIDEAKKEWENVGPAAQILIDVISHHINRGSSPAEAAETVRAALNGSANSVAKDRLTDQSVSCVTVFGGTGFVGRRVVRHLRESGTRVRIVSRHRGLGEDAGIEQIAADARDQRSVEAAVAGAAIAGRMIGYLIGHKFGSLLLLRYGHYAGLTTGRIKLGQYLFMRYGAKIIFFAQFVPVLRTLAGPLAGANLMPWRKFIFANAVSSGLWAASYGYAAYWLGGEFERLQGRMVVPLIFIAAVALVGGGFFVWRRETQLIIEAEHAIPGPLESS